MECDENGRQRTLPAAFSSRGVYRKCRVGCEVALQLPFSDTVPDAGHPISMRVNLVPYYPPEQPISTAAIKPDDPFMNNMDEISYWIYTKRAPCLFNYDNDVKKQIEQAQCSKTKPESVQSACEEATVPKKKKRKLMLLDDDSVSSKKQQNIFFEPTKCENHKTAPVSCKSDANDSNIDFNIKKSSKPNTAKRMKLQRNCQASSQKKNKVVTSTPKVTNLRRSLRKAQQTNNHSQLNSSFEINDASIINGRQEKPKDKEEVSTEQLVADQTEQNKGKAILDKEKNAVVLNGQFEDLSDVSGFTANYIRSTKINSSKTPRKLRNRNNRNIIKDTKQNVSSGDKLLVCVNKSVNTTQLPDTAVLNCSTDSSQNVINLVTVKNNDRSNKVNKSTSLLKFVEATRSDSNNKIDKQGKSNINVSFQSKSSGNSRYPRRQRNNTVGDLEQTCSKINSITVHSPVTRNNSRKTRNSDKKENSQDKTSRTRSGRKLGLKLDVEEHGCSVIELNNTNEGVSSSAALNVASARKSRKTNNSTGRCLRSRCRDKSGQELCKDSGSDKSDKNLQGNARDSPLHLTTPKCVRRVKKSFNKSGHSSRRDSLRDKSGFTACFSESDSDSEPLKRRKFFC